MTFQEFSVSAALKEWALIGEAMAQGRQIVLLRKGGLLDEDGCFQLEHREFLLLPTWLHQDVHLVKPQQRDLFEQTRRRDDESLKVAYFRHFVRVERTWVLGGEAEESLSVVPHVWSSSYLDLRFGYKPEKPLLCAAARVFVLEEPLRYELRAEDFGCRSWVEWDSPLTIRARAALSEAEFAQKITEIAEVLE